jgi:uncharacterized phiE125 gp8 family phage protein
MPETYKITTPPAADPVALAEARNHARVFVDDDQVDALLTGYVKAATAKLEGLVCRSFVARQVLAILDGFPCEGRPIRLLYPPLASVESITYLDGSGIQQELDPSAYDVEADTTPGLIHPAAGKSWPSALRREGSVRVAFTAGYGDASAVPDVAKLCIKIMAAHWYDRREPIVTGSVVADVPYMIDALADDLRWGRYP